MLGKLHFNLEQVQDLTPTPMTLSSVMFYTGENPYTHEPVYVARTQEEKRRQKSYFFRGQASGRSGLADRRGPEQVPRDFGKAPGKRAGEGGKAPGKGPVKAPGKGPVKAPGKGFEGSGTKKRLIPRDRPFW